MPTLNERYPDLLDAHADPQTARFVDALDTLCAETTPPPHLHASIGRALHERAIQRRADPPRARLFPRLSRPIAILAAALVGTTAVAGAAYALASLVDQAFFDPNGQQIVQHNLARSVHISQTACGLTMTVERLYADANRVVIGYTYQGQGPRGAAPAPQLSTADGTPLSPVGGGGTGSIGNASGNEIAYDSSGIVGDATTALNLRFTAPWVKVMIDNAGHVEPGLIACQQPFNFNLSVPVTPGHVITMRQAVTVGGRELTLEKVSLTPSGTSLYLGGETRPAMADMVVDGQTLHEYGGQDNPGLARHDFPPLMDKHGDWTIVVHAIPTVPDPLTGGPWTFHVTLP